MIAFYLPQFHPIPENDKWWGTGFTEWTNVAKAKPFYRSHQQPRLPADLGFYDLRVPETREAQADLAREYGVEGFCYWHYWFGNGRRILERPFNEVLASGKPDFPFCLAWANHSWTKIWKGQSRSMLIEQTYPGMEDERAHFLAMLPAFQDPRYLRVDGKPIFVIFAPHDLPDPRGFIGHWRQLAAEYGLPGIYVVGLTNDPSNPAFDLFDAFTPNAPFDFTGSLPTHLGTRILRRLKKRNFGKRVDRLFNGRLALPMRYKYSDLVNFTADDAQAEGRCLPCVLPNWDNTPRLGSRGYVLENSTPELFAQCLAVAVRRLMSRGYQERIIFLKAWNEWAEGNYMEPDSFHGRGYLEALKRQIAVGSELGPSERSDAY